MVVLKISLLFFCFSSFKDFIFPPLVGSIAEQIEDLLVMYIFGGAGQDTSNQTPS